MKKLTLILLCSLMFAGQRAWSRVTLPTHFTSNMVLQQKTTLNIHGTARPGSQVTLVTGWNKKGVSAQASPTDGKFTLTIQTPKGGQKPYTMTFSDGEETTLENVLIGEVWLGSGQSNMEMPLKGWGKVLNYEEEIANAKYPMIRLLQVKKRTNVKPQEQVELTMDGWQECSPQTVENFSALCYFYALRLWEELKIPVGVIDDDWGGTPVEAWTRAEALQYVTGFEEQAGKMISSGYSPEAMTAYYESIPQEKRNRNHDVNYYKHATGLFNAMIHPLIEFPVRGIIWYQGCDNVGRAAQYQAAFQTMITDWRKCWNNPTMPFYFVQLANFLQPSDLQSESQWALLRESQADALCLPNTGMVTNIDLGDAQDIHPKTKREVGRRMAAIALNQTYGKSKVAYTAPIYHHFTVEEDGVHIHFSTPQGSEPLVREDNLPGFIIAGADRKWHVAKAKVISEDEVVVSNEGVHFPVAVRYGWADNPTCTLRTASDLHVAPFRTDRW